MRSRLWAELGAIAVVLIWAGNLSIVKSAFAVLPPIAYTYVRFCLAAGLVLAMLRAMDPAWRRLARRDWLLAALAGAVGVGIHQPLWVMGLSLTSATDTAIISATSPLFVLLFAWLRREDQPEATSVAGFILSFAGIALVVWGGSAGSPADAPNRLLGDALALAAAVCWALYVVVGAPLMRSLPVLRATAWSIVLGAVIMTPIALPTVTATDWTAVTWSGWGAIVYGAALSTVFGFLVWYQGIKQLGPVRLMAYQNAVAPLSVAVAIAALGEPVGLAQVAGMLIALGGILLARWPTIRLLLRARPVSR